jgi:methyl-accepting chemotaxis protein
MTTLFETVSEAARVQTSGISEVGAAMSRIDKITQQNSDLVRRNQELTDRLAEAGDRLAQTVSAFRGAGVSPEDRYAGAA